MARMASGRLFQRRGAALENAFSPCVHRLQLYKVNRESYLACRLVGPALASAGFVSGSRAESSLWADMDDSLLLPAFVSSSFSPGGPASVFVSRDERRARRFVRRSLPSVMDSKSS